MRGSGVGNQTGASHDHPEVERNGPGRPGEDGDTLSRVRTPRLLSRLEIDTASVLASNAANLALGLVFWAAAARLYETRVVGSSTTMVASAMSVSSFANLGLGQVLERFLPVSGRRAGAVIGRAHLIGGLVGTLGGIGFVAVDPVPGLFSGPAERVVFVSLVVVLGAYALGESVLVGLNAARWTAARNVVLAVLKLILVLVGAVLGTTLALVGSWLLAATFLTIWLGVALARARVPLQSALGLEEPRLPGRRPLGAFWGLSLIWLIGGAVPGFLVPVTVARQLGLESAAHFNAAWMIVSASTVVMTLATGPFVATASRPGADLRRHTFEFLRFMGVVGVLRSVGLTVVGTVALRVYGSSYAAEATQMLWVMAGVHLLSTPSYVYGALARVSGSIAYPTAVNTLGSAALVVAIGPMVGIAGVTGVGLAYLVQELVTVALALVPLVGLLRRIFRRPHPLAAVSS